MATGREEAAPTFPTWKGRLENAEGEGLRELTAAFLEVLRTVGTPMIDGPEVNFVYYGPHASRVLVAGEFNQWGRGGRIIEMTPIGETGVFYYTLKLNEPGRLEYKFIVDRDWQTDPFCSTTVENGVGGENSAFIVGDFQEPPELQAVTNIAHGRVDHFDFRSGSLRNFRKVHVYLPPAYEGADESRFPSLYVHDGGEYLDRARLVTVMDNLISASKIPQLIVVMLDPVNRMREYRANQAYAGFLSTEFVPAIDARYRTIADRGARGVMGASLGGLISVYVALSYPTVFSRVAGQSSALHLAETVIASSLARVKGASFRFYLDVGKYEPTFIPAHQRFTESLKRRRWPCLYRELAAGHNWTSWRAHLTELLVFLWAKESRRGRSTARRV